jgi:hypothetical protein
LRLAGIADDLQRRAALINMSECWLALATRAALAEDGARLEGDG